MAHLIINLVNREGLRLTVSASTEDRNTASENEARQAVCDRVNAHTNHKDHGPWAVASSRYES